MLDKSVYMGKGVLKAVDHVNGALYDSLLGMPVEDQAAIDQLMMILMGLLINQLLVQMLCWLFH